MARKSKEKERFGIRYTSYQKEDFVTGSMHVVEVCGLKLILDMGGYQDNSMNIIDKYNLNAHVLKYDYSDVDYVILSHLHADHVMSTPVLYRNDVTFNGSILATELTAKMTILNCSDSAYLMKSETDAWNGTHKEDKVIPLYSQDEVDEMYIREYDYNQKIRLNDNVYVQMLPTAHVSGSAMIYITVEEYGKIVNSLLYTSDMQYKKIGNKPFTMNYNGGRLKVHNLLIESTYGGTEQRQSSPIDELEGHVLNCIRNNRPLFIGTFAFHRSSELLYYLHEIWKRNDEIRQRNIPIFVAGNLMFNAHRELGKKYTENFFDEEWKDTGLWEWERPIFLRSFKDVQTFLLNNSTKIVIATSGMLDKAYSKFLCTSYLPNKKVDVLLSGYCATGTIGSELINGAKAVLIDGKYYVVRANILQPLSLSGHADKHALRNFIYDCIDKRYLKNIFLVHGDLDRREEQGKLYREMLGDGVNIEVPKRYKSYKL